MASHPDDKGFLSGLETVTSILKGMQSPDARERDVALVRFCERYEPPVKVEISRMVRQQQDVDDLVSMFKVRLITKSLVKSYDRTKGRFRNWLKTCVRNFVLDELPSKNLNIVSTDEVDENGRPKVELAGDEDQQGSAFDYAYAVRVVNLSVEALGRLMAAERKEAAFKEIKRLLFRAEDAERYAVVAKRLGISEGALKQVVHRAKKTLDAIIRQEVRETVGNKEEVDDEFRFLMSLFEKKKTK